MFLKTKDHMGKDIALNIDNIICAQPGYQKGLTKLIMSGNLAIDIAMEFEEFINPAKPEIPNTTKGSISGPAKPEVASEPR